MKLRELLNQMYLEDVRLEYIWVTRYENAPISGISKDSLTPEGYTEWADILDAEIEAICKDMILLKNCDPLRLFRFTQCYAQYTSWENYARWFTGEH